MIRFDDVLDKASAYIGEKDLVVLRKAYVFAARAHKGQVRRSGEPYMSHPLEVAAFLADMRLDRTTLAAGLLHDVLEDTDVTAARLRSAFGKETAALVEGVTKISRVQDASPEASRAETIRKIILAMTDDLRVIFIKLADRIHNLKTLKYLPEDRQRQIARETLDIYAPIANRLGMGRIRAELEDLAFRYVAPEDYFRIASLVEPRRKDAERDLREFARTVEALMKANRIPVEVQSRIKRPYSIWEKTRRRDVGFDQVYDFLAVRLITDSVRNCYAALGIIHQTWPHLPQRFRDFIAMPKPNLYQALHTTVITEDRKTFEVQIRTAEMHAVAENGVAAHWAYKEGGAPGLPKEDRRLHWLREMVALYAEQENPREFLQTLKTNLIPEEVYVFTPKGKVVNLPPGATALDFAFKIHTEIGLHAASARVNGAPAPLRRELRSGDIVEIATDPARSPRRSWLAATVTSDARQRIKRWLNLKSRETVVDLGRRLWGRRLREAGIPVRLRREEALLKRIAAATRGRARTMEEFLRRVGAGKVVLDTAFLAKAFPEVVATRETERAVAAETAEGAPAVRAEGLIIPGPVAGKVALARCCLPVKGEPVVGYRTAGGGLTVHARRCPLVARDLLDEKRGTALDWDPEDDRDYPARFRVVARNAPGVLARVAAAVAEAGANITRADVRARSAGAGEIMLEVRVRDARALERIARGVAAVKDVKSAERIPATRVSKR